MKSSGPVYLVDGLSQRRAAISHRLAGNGVHVEPFEDVRELMARWPRAGIVLVHDEGDAVGQLVSHMNEVGPWLPIVGFAENPTTRMIVRAIQGGAIDYLAWPPEDAQLVAAIAAAHKAAEQQGPSRIRESEARVRIDNLSRREREVLACIAEGLSNRLIGERLSISPRTVEIHRANMMTKMGASHVSEAIRAAFDAALV
ncbi:MAG: LuxR family transcriptional regulator [Sphingomonadales bacterium]|nr:LuxR family transcriptional regulator [Sphingomonadales bacterium]